MKVSQIRSSFLDFFRERGHTIVPSDSLFPPDPTLLFTNSGMNQFKDVFLGNGTRPYKRAADTQKCIRAGGKQNDLDTVGRDGYHQTFFEMLGNWSFGDYFKAEAIEWAWDLLTKTWGIDKNKLYATVHHSDDEAALLWPKITGISPSRVLKFGKDNFWEMGYTGPCGPCTEIHVDRGPGVGPDTGVNSGSERYIEIWNLVFIQFNRKADGSLEPLPAKHVDTGMGLERVTQILQGVTSNYDTDLFKPIIASIEDLTKVKYPGAGKEGTPHRAIADHARCLSFAIADGILPGPNERGFVLRRILRRASRFFHKLGVTDRPALRDIVPAVVSVMGDAFPEVKKNQAQIMSVIQAEEEQFLRTLDRGVAYFEKERAAIVSRGDKVVPGDLAYKLKDEMGFPIDVTEQMAEEAGLKIDMARFKELEEEQKQKARAGGKFKVDLTKYKDAPATQFMGYGHTNNEAKVVRADERELVLDASAFYAESGGQVGDTGKITAVDGSFEFEVVDTQKSGPVWVHLGEWLQGDASKVKKGAQVLAQIDAERRASIRRNHTGTHLLHWALHQVVGPKATQKGSLVEPARLRFDFACDRALGDDELGELERLVNARITENHPVAVEEMPIAQAKEKGAIAMFGEKYGETVRVVDIAGFSCEFCGGTHVHRTGDIGAFKIVQETSVQAGVRRLVALTANDAVRRAHEESRLLATLTHELKAQRPDELLERIRRLQAEVKELEKRNKAASARSLPSWDELKRRAEAVKGVQLLAVEVPGANLDVLRQFGDAVKRQPEPFVGFFFGQEDDKVPVACAVSASLVEKGWHSKDLLKPVAAVIGGGGGGKPELSTGSGKDASKVGEAVALARKVVADKVG